MRPLQSIPRQGFQVTSSSRTAFDYKPMPARASTHARWFVSGLLLPLIGGIITYAMAPRDSSLMAPRQPVVSLQNLPPIEIDDVAIPMLIHPLLGDTAESV